MPPNGRLYYTFDSTNFSDVLILVCSFFWVNMHSIEKYVLVVEFCVAGALLLQVY